MNLHNYKLNHYDGILAHTERRKKDDGSYYRYSNLRIDLERTTQNYNLAEKIQPLDQNKFINSRLKAVRVLKRDDVTCLCDWIITAPKSLPPEDIKKFMKISFNFLCEEYGEKNVVSSYVHMDETTPHMHFLFLPIVDGINKKTGKKIEKLSNKEANPYTKICGFHNKLQDYVSEKLGYPVVLATGITNKNGGNKSVNELIQETEEKMLRLINTKLKQLLNLQDKLKLVLKCKDS